MITIEYRKRIREQLPQGSISKIAEMAGDSQCNVSNWFHGRTDRINIEKAVFDFYIAERKRTQRMLAEAELI